MKTLNRQTAQSAKQPRKIRIRDRNKERARKSGLPPGTLVHIGRPETEPVKITVMDYTETRCQEKQITDPEQLRQFQQSDSTTWINVDGLSQVDVIAKICGIFRIHPLIQEDVVNTDQRPKMDDSENYLFIVLKTLNYDEKQEDIVPEQVSLVIGSHFVISFQEIPGDAFDPIRQRIRGGLGRICMSGSDYLAYAILDSIVDNYFDILEKLAEKIEVLEDELVTNPSRNTLEVIHKLKTDMIFLRRSIWPLREVLSKLASGQSSLVQNSTLPYFRDVYDHTIHAVDTMETYRDIVSGMLDIYLSSMNNRLNEIMKILTIIATLFMPLTFLTGWYGMNFKNMPELQWQWGYPMVILIALLVTTTMLVYFRLKKWI
ncbi:MAG TPA: magnesium/cobalt transporter CorA [Desulfomonilaceae bacterium]|nr:magnesium/cobalt transporter CorA [Desulfomonilaceae bacterium]